MIKKTGLLRILYTGTGLVIVVTLILAFIVIPSVLRDTSPQADPERAVPGILVVIIIHLVIVAALIRTILFNQQSGRIEKGLLIGLGVLLLLLSLMVLDGASAYSEHTDPIMKRVAISMFICTGFNFIAGMLTFLTALYSKRSQPPLK
jgi:membrane protease YdiL (CAAX protease family)